jgi:hypothetical protein
VGAVCTGAGDMSSPIVDNRIRVKLLAVGKRFIGFTLLVLKNDMIFIS